MSGYDGSGNTVIEISETRNYLAGWSITTGGINNGAGVILGTTGGNKWGVAIDDDDDATNFWRRDNDDGQVEFQVGSSDDYLKYDSAATPTLEIKVATFDLGSTNFRLNQD